MIHAVEKGRTLLVDGPASLRLLSGEVEVLNATFKVGERMVIREGKRVPFEVYERAEFELNLGENASFEEAEGSTVPSSWKSSSEQILLRTETATVMVMGCVDSGKTSFCSYLANKALKKERRPAIIDADPGQSDIGPPSTIGVGLIKAPTKDLFKVEVENAVFVGLTSPSGAVGKLIDGIIKLKKDAFESGANFLIINTDGWVEGDDAVKYKVELVEKVAPDVVVGIQREEEMTPILSVLKDTEVFVIEPSLAVRKRDRDERRVLRELSYKKYLRGAKVQSFALNRVNIEGAHIGSGSPMPVEHMERVRNILGLSPLYCEETTSVLFLIVGKNQRVREERIVDLEEKFGKRIEMIKEGDDEGLLVALQDASRRFLGIGVLSGIDYKRRVVKVYTPISKGVATISIGQIRLDEKCGEIGISQVFAKK